MKSFLIRSVTNQIIPVVLALSLNKKSVGVAVFGGLQLIDFARINLPKKLVTPLLRTTFPSIVQDLLTLHQPEVLVVRAPSQYQKLSTIVLPAEKIIKKLAKQNGIKFASISPSEIINLLAGQTGTQKEVFRSLVQFFPELERVLNYSSDSQLKYHSRLYAAVSAGLTYVLEPGSITIDTGVKKGMK